MDKKVYYFFHKTKYGEFTFASTDVGLIRVNLPSENLKEIFSQIQITKPENLLHQVNNIISDAFVQLDEYLAGQRKSFDIPFDIADQGTEFQKKVWNVLKSIPYGKTLSYKEVALKINNPGSVRAIGQANKSNPLAIFIPCHRVVGSKKGDLGGYAGKDPENINLKEKLITLESHKQKKLNNFF